MGVTTIHRLSPRSLHVYAFFNNILLGDATAFIVSYNNRNYLITNRHVVTGRHPDSNKVIHKQGAVPNRLEVLHHGAGPSGIGNWVIKTIEIPDDGQSKPWIEHPYFEGRVDVVALELAVDTDIQLHPYQLTDPEEADMRLNIGLDLFAIGFPFGESTRGHLPLWIRGSIASEPETNWRGMPRMLIDARTREGQSGSPVVMVSNSGMFTSGDGSAVVGHGGAWSLVGVYSGRISDESDLGIVWKRAVIKEILDQRKIPWNSYPIDQMI